MNARARWSKRLAVTAAGVLVALGFPGASTPSQNADPEFVIELTTAGPGTVTISPAEGAPTATCQTNGQEYQTPQEACIHHFASPTRVTLEAVPRQGPHLQGLERFRLPQHLDTLHAQRRRRYAVCQRVVQPGLGPALHK